jgi:hypothetical protein
VSITSINPIALCPYHEIPETWRTLNKKIDFAIGLEVPNGEKNMLQKGTYCSPIHTEVGTSMNQASGWVNYTPMFVEVKKKNVSDDPMIQIGACVGAVLKKREL